MRDPIGVLLVDDQQLMRDGLRLLLELEGDMVVVGEAGDGATAVARYGATQPDVVLMDIRMPDVDGVTATAQLRARWPDARVIILTTFADEHYLFAALRAGASGYLLKDVSGQELAQAVRTVAGGSALFGPAMAAKVLDHFTQRGSGPIVTAAELLSPREAEILPLIADGLSNGEIAARLHLAEGTVKNYVSGILQKTDSRDRTQAVARARRLGWLTEG